MLAVWHYSGVAAEAANLRRHGEGLLVALAARPGYRRGQLGEAVDEPGRWVLVTEWDGLGSYRRAMSAYDVRLATAALPGLAAELASAFDVVLAEDRVPAQSERPLP